MIDPVTTRYVEALFQLARREGALDDVERDVERLARALEDGGLGAVVFDARLSQPARRAELEPHLGSMHRLTRNFVHLLFDKRREDVLRGLRAAFHRRALLERGTVEGVVESARPLASDDVSRLAGAIGGRVGRTVLLENRVRPELIGGVRVLVENRMLDRSVAGRLEGLRKTMLDAPLPAAHD